MKGTVRQSILLGLMNRYVLVLVNIILVGIILSIINEVTELALTPENNTDEMVHLCNGIAIILYGYGVAIEFRGSLMKNFRLYPAFADRLQEATDTLCHVYGIYFLLLGLVQEILIHIVIMRSRVLDIIGNENYIFAICVAIQTVVTVLVIMFTFSLITVARRLRQGEEPGLQAEDN
ncbi:MAG TPA: hypothetical protein PLM53_11940 [Spirochaetota bacterium]|nr:hypothetical protein [Spirochaetota bacterium]HQF10311.1 hypothetical protein [Spirochaetota bacterium]HQH97805.1 hypothetical protein [Spirochaetota bacterium]